ncbi:MAG: hypothetical protein V4590_07935 [Bacteroidota bacterium]
MKFKFINVSGMSLTPKGITKSIFLIVVLSVFSGGYSINTCVFWMAFTIADYLIGKAFISMQKLTPDFLDRYQIPGITITHDYLAKMIFTLIMLSKPTNTFLFSSYIFWASYLIVDQFGRRIAKERWTKEIGSSVTHD